ncbi:MAG TPA: GlpM family protein [Bacillota bacterium]|nr:GlpM family protein [Bacillota bacterium]
MSVMEGLIRFFCGGLLILGIGLVSKSANKNIAGLLALFPIVTAVGYFFMSRDLEASGIKKIILISIMGLPTVLVFLLGLYLTIDKMPVMKAILLSIVAWIISAIGVLTLKKLLL